MWRFDAEWESALSRYFLTAKGPAKFDMAVRQLQLKPFDHARKVRWSASVYRHLLFAQRCMSTEIRRSFLSVCSCVSGR